jgi:hypothetical protein
MRFLTPSAIFGLAGPPGKAKHAALASKYRFISHQTCAPAGKRGFSPRRQVNTNLAAALADVAAIALPEASKTGGQAASNAWLAEAADCR